MGRRELSELEQEIYGEVFEEGIEKGIEEGVDKVVLNMLKHGFSFSEITEATEYCESKVKELKRRFIKEGLLSS